MPNFLDLKIGYVSTFYPQRCGIATYTGFLIEGLRKVSPNVKIRVIAEKGAMKVKEENFEVIPSWGRDENYVLQILGKIDDVDILHIQHEYSIYKLDDRLPTLLKRIPKNVKKVVTIHCIRPSQVSERGVIEEKYVEKIAKLADHVIVHLQSQKDILIRLGISEEKISVIPHGTKIIDIDKNLSREKLGLPKEGYILLMFGFVKPHKNFHIVLEALKKILNQIDDVYLFIAGGLAPNAPEEHVKYVEFLRKRIRELKLDDKVIFPNRYYPEEYVPYIFGASDVVLFPYYEEDRSASGSLHLAIGAGKPVIASRIPKFEELKNISDELLVLPYNYEAIANLVLRILKDDDFRSYIVNKLNKYRIYTSWENVARKHLLIYRDVLAW